MTTDGPDRLAVIVTGASVAMDITSHLASWQRAIDGPVHVLLTHAALNFVSPRALRYLVDEVTDPATPQFNPVRFANRARLLAVCPATANFVVSASLGLASSPALTAALATEAPKLIFPHMNPVMWKARTTQTAIRNLREDGCIVVSPEPAKVFTLWNRSLTDGEALPPPSRTTEIVASLWRAKRAA